jgi:hypothetical protein
MITIKTPTRIVTIVMFGVTADGYIDGIDYSSDYIGSLFDANLHVCDCEDAEHTYHADDETAQWWYDRCREMEAHERRVSQLTPAQRDRFRAAVESEHTYSCDAEDEPVRGNELLDRLFGAEDEDESATA